MSLGYGLAFELLLSVGRVQSRGVLDTHPPSLPRRGCLQQNHVLLLDVGVPSVVRIEIKKIVQIVHHFLGGFVAGGLRRTLFNECNLSGSEYLRISFEDVPEHLNSKPQIFHEIALVVL